MKISIALATYNGTRYLREQLDSFMAQSRSPDELVITDDNSTDDTISIIKSFASQAPFEIRYSVNEKNIGYAANFERAIQQCTGDLIFLSDQDDIWFPEKIARIEAGFEQNPDVLLIMCDARLVYADGRQTQFTNLNQIIALGLTDHLFSTGCCMAFRRILTPLLLPIPIDSFKHDVWINKLAILLNGKHIIPEVMQYYRRHCNNTSEWIASRIGKFNQYDLYQSYRNKDPRRFYFNRLKQIQKLEQRLQNTINYNSDFVKFSEKIENALEILQIERLAVKTRIKVMNRPRWRRLPHVLAAWAFGHYRFFQGWKSALIDLIRV